MWIVANRDEKQRNRTILLLQSEGVAVQGIGDESDFDEWSEPGVTLLLFYDGWNAVTVRRMKERFACDALYVGAIDQVTAEIMGQKLKEGYADVLSHPPQVEAARRWERQEDTEAQVAASRTTYTKLGAAPSLDLDLLKGPRGKIIAFTSYGGDVGKSAISSITANVIRATGKTVVLVEVDHMGKQMMLHGIVPQVTIGSFERLSPDISESALQLHLVETKYHWHLVPRGQGEPPISIQTLLKVIYLCSKYHDYVILDCHPDTNPLSVVSAKEADFVFIMTRDEVSRYGGVDELVSMFGLKADPRAHLIINNYQHVKHARQLATDIQNTHHLASAHLIPHDKELFRRIQAREAVVGTKSQKAVQDMLRQMGVL